ncbi:MAG TPA: hypothetical protein VMH33_02805 [Solirubrobacterales bacterium]|nr:hypothetical protein [Solirubrobacterales bacterium]
MGIATIAAFALVLLVASPAGARDLRSSIAAAEERAETAATEAADLKTSVGPALAHLKATGRRAAPVRLELRTAERRATAIKAREHARVAAAAARVRGAEEANRRQSEKHEEKVTSGIGIGLSLLIIGWIVLAWGWFRASAAVAALTRVTLAQALGLCVGGGLLALIVGGALHSSGGVVAVLGMTLALLGLTLPCAFLFARHSAEIQRGRSRPILRRERFPSRVTQVLAAIVGVLCLVGFGSAIFASTAKSGSVPASTRSLASVDLSSYPPLVAAEARTRRLRKSANPLLAHFHSARRSADKAKREVGHAESRMVAADHKARRLTRRLAALEAREQRELEADERREERELAREQRREEKEYEAEQRVLVRAEEEAEEAEACDPNYEGACLHDGIGDYDCAGGSGDGPNYVEGPIYVVGADPFGLDEDGDGIACEDG